jgi:MFS family permease
VRYPATPSNSIRDRFQLGNKELWAVSVASGIRSIGFGATWPYMAIFLNQTLGVPVYFVGVIFTLGSIVSIVFSIIGGALADLFGRKKVLLLGSSISGILFLVVALLLSVSAPAVLIIAAFIFTSAGGSLIFPSANALVADVTSPAERTNGYVVYRIMSNLGWAIGPLSGALIYDSGIIWIFTLITVSSVIQGIMVLFLVKDRWKERGKKENLKKTGKISILSFDRFLIIFTVGTFFLTLVSSQFSVTLPVFMKEKIVSVTSYIGLIYAVNGVVVVVGQYPITNFMKKYPEILSMILGAAAYSVGYLLVGFSTSLLDLMGDMVIITVGENLVSPVMNSIVSKIAPRDKLARYLGFMGMMNSSGRAFGPSVGTFLISLYAFNGLRLWSTIDLFGLASIALFFAFSRVLPMISVRPNEHQVEDHSA